jgi:hypothetical protein
MNGLLEPLLAILGFTAVQLGLAYGIILLQTGMQRGKNGNGCKVNRHDTNCPYNNLR